MFGCMHVGFDPLIGNGLRNMCQGEPIRFLVQIYFIHIANQVSNLGTTAGSTLAQRAPALFSLAR
jgi:hypothetical protein